MLDSAAGGALSTGCFLLEHLRDGGERVIDEGSQVIHAMVILSAVL